MKRGSGILMPIFSLQGDFGIGTLGKYAYEFVDFLKNSGQSYWQILPLGHTTLKGSPYECYSAFAGNPYFIDLDILVEEHLLEKKDFSNNFFDNVSGNVTGKSVGEIDYKNLHKVKLDILRISLNTIVDMGAYGYTYRSEQYYKSIIGWLKRRHAIEIYKENILPGFGVMFSISTCIKALTF